MKLFIDTANIAEIREAASWGVISGVTTNPTLFLKAGAKDFKQHTLEITRLVNGPVNIEAVSDKAPAIIKEAKELAGWHKNIVVKIAMSEEGVKATRELSRAGVKINMSLVFSVNQALLAALAGADYVSPFVGRLDDAGEDGMAVVRDMVDVFARYGFKTQVIAASIRSTSHVINAAKAGAPIATVPFAVLKQMFRHPLTDAGIKKFLEDWEAAKKKK